MGIIIKGGISNNLAEVDSNNNLKVTLPTILSATGYASMVAEVDDGSIIGTKLQRQLDSSYDYRLRAGIDKIIWQDSFNHAVFNSGRYAGVTNTMTITVAGGFLNLNAGNAVASGNVARVNTFRTFSLYPTYPLYVDFRLKFTAAFQTNSVIEFGLGYATTTTAPTDGIFFRVVSGALIGVQNNNGAEVTVSISFVPTIGKVDHYLIVVGMDGVEFWINNVLYGSMNTPDGLGGPCQSNSLPLLLRNYNSGAVSSAIQLNVAQIGVSNGDMDMGKDWGTNMVGNGLGSLSAPDGQAAGITANYVNSTAPANSILANATASYSTLGGQFIFSAQTGSETDYALFGYQNPAGTAAIPGKNLYITGVRIDSFLSGATLTGATHECLQWGLGVGSTAVSLATTDSATSGTRAPRKIPLGTQTFTTGTTSGSQADKAIDVRFTSPLMVEPSTFLHVILKVPTGVGSSATSIRGVVGINGYYE